jgi:hypothetical protein
MSSVTRRSIFSKFRRMVSINQLTKITKDNVNDKY